MLGLKNYIDPDERQNADKVTPRLMFEGLLLGGTGLGVLALIFEIAADAFSVAAYQTLLAIHGAHGYHTIAIIAFMLLSVMLFFGIVPAYKAGAYLRPNAGGSGPLVEAIGPPRLRWLSWVGTSLFFIDAVLTIIISSISASDVTMLVFPEFAPYRIVIAEVYAFFIMAVLVAVGPKRAVPLFLLGGGAFTIFTIIALSMVSATALGNPQWAFLTDGIVTRLQTAGVVEHVVRVQQDISTLAPVVFIQITLRSMSSAMLGFSGYEVIPASGKHAARPKWKVINTALTLAAVFLIGTGVMQLLAAEKWNIPATEGYSTLLIEYEIMAAQTMGRGVDPDSITITENDIAAAEVVYEELHAPRGGAIFQEEAPEQLEGAEREAAIEKLAAELAFSKALDNAIAGTSGEAMLFSAAILLAIILLLAQGGGYVGGAAVAANAARLGRMPRFFLNDSIGIAVIWGIAAILIPIIREVVVVESYYAFGFVSAFIITSTTVFMAREEVLRERGIEPGSGEAKSLKFAGLRGMIASYAMGLILVTQKTDALAAIIIAGGLLTAFQVYHAYNGFRRAPDKIRKYKPQRGAAVVYASGAQRAQDEARQRGVAALMNNLIEEGALVKFNVEPERLRTLVSYIHSVDPALYEEHEEEHQHEEEHVPEPSVSLEDTYQEAYGQREKLIADIEFYSHYGIFTFIDKYYHNWVNYEHGRDPAAVQRAMLQILFPLTDLDDIWDEYENYDWIKQPEPIWQFARLRYQWAKDQWPNLSDRITTVWTLQEFGLLPDDVDVPMIISVSSKRNDLRKVEIHTSSAEEIDDAPELDPDAPDSEQDTETEPQPGEMSPNTRPPDGSSD